jgi:hypothetical protein
MNPSEYCAFPISNKIYCSSIVVMRLISLCLW